MMASEKIDLRNLDKSDWPTYRFDEIAQHISERVDPNNTDLEVYIGLEHIDSESLQIRRFGTPGDVNGTKLKFYKGDIIFGRRRAYQRKAGIATMDGFCSAHALVLRANPDIIDPKLFPFFIHSDLFMNRAVDISVGSLSPTINWGSLRHQTFRLPPENIQGKLATCLWTANTMLEKEYELISIHKKYVDSFRKELFSEREWPKVRLDSLFDVQLGKMLSAKARNGKNQKNYLTNKNVQWDSFNLNTLKTMSFNERETRKFSLKDGDLLVCEGGEVGRTAIWRDQLQDCYYQKALHRLRVIDKGYLPEVFLEYMIWASAQNKFKALTGHSTIAHLTAVTLKGMRVPDIPLETQNQIRDDFTSMKRLGRQINLKYESTKSLFQHLINLVI